jgi:DNA helicase II / ATP-dependent DNA helicase PcrA
MTIQKQLEEITSQILPKGFDFSDQQKAAIMADGSVNVVAGPGSGKTTVLIAKFALLLQKTLNKNQGICLITHTNVAVDEIKLGLKKFGISNIEYPNFIGTIQEFFNTFFAKKAYHLVNAGKTFRVLDDDEYSEKFDELFQQCKPEWYTFTTPNISKGSPKIVISEDLSITIMSSAKPSYKSAFELSIKRLFNMGIVTNSQCLELTKWYVEKYKEQTRKAISKRFKYVLLDEAQDTNLLQYELLKTLFSNTGVFFQRFGDPYQALYSIFEGNNDSWVPSAELDIPYLEISETSRFGSNITKIVRNVCIEKYDSFKSLNIIPSFDPYIIIYDNEMDLLQQYRGLISKCEKETESFLYSQKKDAILSTFHDDLGMLFSRYKRPTIKPLKNEAKIKKIYNFLLALISKEMDMPFKELKDLIDLSLVCKMKISGCIKELINENPLVGVVKYNLEEIMEIISDSKVNSFSNINVEEQVRYFHQISSIMENNHSTEEEFEFYIGTIHSVKGETHRSTLLVLDTVFKEYSTTPASEHWIFDLLKEYLAGNYVNPYTIEDKIKSDETIKSLKLAYVALSRPTHLAAIAIPANLVTKDDDIFNRLSNNGWVQYEERVGQLGQLQK